MNTIMEQAQRRQTGSYAGSRMGSRMVETVMIVTGTALFALFLYVLWIWVPRSEVRYTLLALCGGICLLAVIWCLWQRKQVCGFAEELCRTLDELMAGREPENYDPYEDTLTARVQGKFLQYYDLMSEQWRRSLKDKQTIQELVSDISHQVKTPIANLSMFIGILQKHQLSEEKQSEFLATMAGQIDKLDFLMQSLIKMSRLETGTFMMHTKETSLYDTIAQALNGVLARAEAKHIGLSVACDESVMVRHDSKWTAEALGNILTMRSSTPRRAEAYMSMSVHGSFIRAWILQIPELAYRMSTAMTCSNVSIAERMPQVWRESVLDSIWRKGL